MPSFMQDLKDEAYRGHEDWIQTRILQLKELEVTQSELAARPDLTPSRAECEAFINGYDLVRKDSIFLVDKET